MLKLEYFAKSRGERDFAEGVMRYAYQIGLDIELNRICGLIQIKFKTKNHIYIIYSTDENVINTVNVFCRAFKYGREEVLLERVLEEVENIDF